MTINNTGRFVWFEYVSSNAPKAQGFFGELFNWGTQVVPMPQGSYTMIAAGKQRTIGGYLPTPDGAPPHAHWLAHLCVANVAEAAAKAKSLGARIAKEPTKVGDFGTMAVVVDTAGAVFALWQPAKPEEMPGVETGTFCWNELFTTDPAAAVKFYRQLGFAGDETMDMAEMGSTGQYRLLKDATGVARAGVMKTQMPEQKPAWMPYVQVANTDATLDKAKKLGATVIVPGTEIPNVGRFGILLDTQGAAIGVLQPPAAR